MKEQLKSIDIGEYVRSEIRKQISAEVKREIARAVRDQITSMIQTEIDIVLSNPVETNDGWGTKNRYGSFEELYKKELHAKITKSYDMKRAIEAQVKIHVERLYQSTRQEAIGKVVELMTKEMK